MDADGDTSTASEWSPEGIHYAIEDWKKLTGKDPADYLLRGLVEADRESFADVDKPFREFLGSRASQLAPGSGTAQ